MNDKIKPQYAPHRHFGLCLEGPVACHECGKKVLVFEGFQKDTTGTYEEQWMCPACSCRYYKMAGPKAPLVGELLAKMSELVPAEKKVMNRRECFVVGIILGMVAMALAMALWLAYKVAY